MLSGREARGRKADVVVLAEVVDEILVEFFRVGERQVGEVVRDVVHVATSCAIVDSEASRRAKGSIVEARVVTGAVYDGVWRRIREIHARIDYGGRGYVILVVIVEDTLWCCGCLIEALLECGRIRVGRRIV